MKGAPNCQRAECGEGEGEEGGGEREGEGEGEGEGAQTSLPLHEEDTQSRLARPLRKLAKSIFHNLMPVRMPVRALLRLRLRGG